MDRPEAGVDDGVRATFDEVNPFELRKRRFSASQLMSAKRPRVLAGIGHIFCRTIDGHQAQAKEEGSPGFWRRHRTADGMKEGDQRFGS